MKNLVYLSFYTSLLFTAACKREQDTKPTVPLADLTAYSYFKKGTYWIYKDSTSGVEDSVYVYSDTSFKYHQTNTVQKDGDYMYYDCRTHSYLTNFNCYYRISMGDYSISTRENSVDRTRTNPYVGDTYLMSDRFVDGDQIGLYTSPGTVYFKNKFSNYMVLGNSFQNTVKFYDSTNPSEFNSPTNFYIAKNIGIVRFEILDSNKVWNVIRYSIKQ